MESDFPNLGFGCGLRTDHYSTFLESPPSAIDWIEVVAESYLDWSDGRRLRALDTLLKIRQNFPVVLHGVSLSLGSTDPLDMEHLKRVKELFHRVDASWFSDHLCWTGVDGQNMHDLLPLPYTEEAIQIVSDNISRTQDFLGRRILIENVSSYLSYQSSQMPEWEFIRAILQRSGCGLLLDINNIYVSHRNHGFDALAYLNAIPRSAVGQIHLAGHTDQGTYVVDTHDEPVCDAVWDLYQDWTAANGPVTTMIEWDDKIPPWPRLEAEVQKARLIADTRKPFANTDANPARV